MSYLHQFGQRSDSTESTRWLDSTITGHGKPQRRERRWVAAPRDPKAPDYETTPQAVRSFTSGRRVEGRVHNGLLTANDRQVGPQTRVLQK